jgi:phage tail-like protein
MLIPGIVRYGPLVLRDGITTNTELWEWMESIIEGTDDRRAMSVIILDRQGNDITRYNLSEAWPSGYSVDKLDSMGSSVAIEELVIQYEKLERETD